MFRNALFRYVITLEDASEGCVVRFETFAELVRLMVLLARLTSPLLNSRLMGFIAPLRKLRAAIHSEMSRRPNTWS